MAPRRRAAGFTLVEVLVALLAMAILSGFAWQALDGVMKSREAGREVVDRTTRLATVLTQWEQDLRAVHDTGAVPALASTEPTPPGRPLGSRPCPSARVASARQPLRRAPGIKRRVIGIARQHVRKPQF